MAEWRAIQNRFTAGELSPRFHAQVDQELYQLGLAECTNMQPVSQGPVGSRPGSEYLLKMESSKGPVTNARIIPLTVASGELVIALLGGEVAKVYSQSEIPGSEQLIKNPEFILGTTDWEVITTAWASARPVGGGGLWLLINENNAVHTSAIELRQKTTSVTPPDSLILEYILENQSDRAADIYMDVATDDYGVGVIYSKSFLASAPGKKIAIQKTLPGGAGYTGDIYIRFWTTVSWFEFKWLVESVTITGAYPPPPPVVELPIPYLDADLDDVQYIQNPYEPSMVFAHGKYPLQELYVEGGAWAWRDFPLVGGANPPDWDAAKGYPRVLGSFGGRLMAASTRTYPQTLWGSEVGSWKEFTGGGSDPADPIISTLTHVGAIQWIQGQKQLLLGSVNAEFQVIAETNILQAGDIAVRQQSGYGSAPLQTVLAGEDIFYVSSDRRKVRGANYSRDMQGWKSIDKTWISEHITAPGIRRMAESGDPFQVLWCPLEDGTMAVLSYEPSYNLLGWAKFITSGAYIDIATTDTAVVDYTFVIVRRTVGNETVFYLESFPTTDAATSLGAGKLDMDCFKQFNFGEFTSVITGLEHLEGLPVQVVGDGAVYPDAVVTGGQITIDPPARKVTVGLQFIARIRTLPQPPGEAGLQAAKGWSNIGVKLLGSANPLVNGVRERERHPITPMNTPEPAASDDVFMTELGWDIYGQITVEQDLPLPLNVLGIYGKVAIEDV